MEKRIIFNKQEIEAIIKNIAEQIIARNRSMDHVALVGIRTGGAFLAGRLKEILGAMKPPEPPTGVLDITLYRDDWTRIDSAPIVGKTDISFSIDDKTIILIDDVLFTGRTIRAAMDALIDFGRPKKIELAILIDRGDEERELPIKANYIGGEWHTAPNETVNVYLEEAGFEDHVTIENKKPA
jgi:pyrimidine operon attenuation protein/uracil phosphoribosyltransferase